MATRELKWDDNKQEFVGSFAFRGRTSMALVSVTLDELPAGAQIKYNKKTGQAESVTVPFEFAQEQLNKTEEKESVVGTKEEFLQAKQDATNTLPDGSPLPNQKVKLNVTRETILKGKEVLLGSSGVVYIDPETKDDDAMGVQVVIKPYAGYYGQEFEVVSAETEMANVLAEAGKSINGIRDLKQRLFESGYYNAAQIPSNIAAKSIRMGNKKDVEMQAALSMALQTLSVANYGLIQDDRSAQTLDGYLDESAAAFAGSNDDRTVNLPGKLTAEQAAISGYQRFLGRNPNQNEIFAFISAANDYAKSNPDLRSYDYSSGAVTTINQPGFSEEELSSFTQDYVTAQPGATEYGTGQGGFETFNGAINILLQEMYSQGARRVKPGDVK